MLGRPTNYEEKFCEMLIEHMAKGYSFESFGFIVKRARSTIFQWKQEGHAAFQKDFADAYEMAKDASLYFYEGMGIEGMHGQLFVTDEGKTIIRPLNTGVWALNMRNRFGWKDKIEVSGPDNKPLVLSYSLREKEEGKE